MLQEIRERAQGWVAWAIVILISIPFALWGIQSYLGVGAEPVVAKVNDTEITERQFNNNVQRTRMRLRDRLGAAYDPALFGGQQLREQVLDGMIRDEVLLDASLAMGLRVSDAAVRGAILSEPAFQVDGGFDKDTYERVLRLQGLSPAVYEEQLRRSLLTSQLPRAVTATAFATPSMVADSVRLLRQQRELAYVQLPSADFAPESPPSDAEIQAFYESHQQDFETPEQVRVSYLLLNADSIATPDAELDEAVLRDTYEARIQEFTEPEQRGIRHILLSVAADAAESEAEAVKARIEALRERILGGESFAEVASEASEDPGSASAGGDLGLVPRGVMDPAFEQAAFALAPETLSEPVRSRFGYHLIEVTEVQGGEVKPFEAVREQLVAELGSNESESIYFDWAERLATLTYESPDSLIPAAESLDLEVQTSDWIDRDGGEGILANPKVVAAAFSEDVLTRGNNSELMEPDPEVLQAIVLRVDEHRPAAVQPLEDVRDAVIARLEQEQAAEAAMEAAEAMVSALEGGAALEEASADYSAERPGLVGRTAAAVPGPVLDLAFTLPRPGAGAASYAAVADEAGGAYVVAVQQVVDGNPGEQEAAAREAEARVLAAAVGRSAYEHLLDDLESRANIERSELPSDDEP